eukprot:2603147-Ditylum_brightwellii.AAC.1
MGIIFSSLRLQLLIVASGASVFRKYQMEIIPDNHNVSAETAMGKYLSERLNSVSKRERIQDKSSGKQNIVDESLTDYY